jgi:hypothetical protein
LIGGKPFDLDVAALPDNAKAPWFFTPPEYKGKEGCGRDGLKQEWVGKRIWVNGPYRQDKRYKNAQGKWVRPPSKLGEWIEKAYNEATRGKIVVCLHPYWVGSDWFHRFIVQGQFIILYGGHGLPMGRGALDYWLTVFDFTRPHTWKVGLASFKNGIEFLNF